MRMKEGYMKNGQFSTNNQFVVNYTVEKTSPDTTTLPGHLSEHERLYGQYPEAATAGSGYGAKKTMSFWKRTTFNPL